MTMCSTLGAVVLTPLLTLHLAGTYVPIDAVKLSISTLQVVVAPVLLGSLCQSTFPAAVKVVAPFAPLCAVLVSSLLASSVFSENVVRLRISTASGPFINDLAQNLRLQAILSSELGLTILAVLLLHGGGFFIGYIAAAIAGFREPQRRAISIEVGMQNSSLGVVLAASHFSSPLVALPPAISAVIMNIIEISSGVVYTCLKHYIIGIIARKEPPRSLTQFRKNMKYDNSRSHGSNSESSYGRATLLASTTKGIA
ncbi:hypothetical protein Cgig2_030155 [Carnegiea gigantea]|uniref:Uncharacterized protein n=1 Tax=Carnegiea gigantea TaxID=171969 RepID=A0A9Q1GKD0_9CARY|nr:hypothetical protein Cgig2_030155 [Carnegiea gigantea]